MRSPALVLALAAVYAVTGKLGLSFATVGSNVTLLWAPAGIALAALLLGGVRLWPGVFLGAAAVNVWVGADPFSGLFIAAGNTLQALYGALLLPRFLDVRRPFVRPQDLFAFLAVGVLTGPIVAATIGASSLGAFGLLPWNQFWTAWGTWWLGDGAGVLIVTPLLLTWATEQPHRPDRSGRVSEVALLAAAIVAIPLLVAASPWPALHHYAFALLVFPVLVWGALRFGAVGAATVSLAVAVLAIWGTLSPTGFLVRESTGEALALVWALIGVAAPTALLMAILSESDRAMRKLQESERVVRESEARYRAIFEQASDSILLVNPETGGIDEFNDMAHEALGYTREEFSKLSLEDLDALESQLEIQDHAQEIARTGFKRFETRHRAKDGSVREVIVAARPIRISGETRIVSVIRDVTELKRALAREAALGRLIDQSRNEMYVIDAATKRFLMVNSGARDNLGYTLEELRQMTPYDVVRGEEAEDLAERMRLVVSEGIPQIAWAEHERRDGSRYPVEAHLDASTLDGARVVVAAIIDVTERVLAEEEQRRTERQLQEAQKLESLGVLAGGIAHDFNNLLVGIMGNAGLALEDLPSGSSVRQNLQDIEVASQRAAELCRQMLAYSGRGRFHVKPLDLSALVADMQHLLVSSVPKSVRLDFVLADELPPVEGDATQLSQVVMNLVTNAADASEPGGKSVAIETALRFCDRGYLDDAELGQPLPEGWYVVMGVVDGGAGLSPTARQRMFEPFFSDKEGGRGLGLAATLGIVRGHRGAIRVDSEPGRGTRIDVVLPPTLRALKRQSSETRAAPEEPGGDTVLVVDDEELVRTFVERTLAREGFRVLTAPDGETAIALFEGQSGSIDCVVLDMTMPGLNGAETFDRLQQIRSSVPVILSSGFDGAEMHRSFGRRGFASFLQKPYKPHDLVRRIRSVVLTASQDRSVAPD
jgi:PAS domain S-box-containing protein